MSIEGQLMKAYLVGTKIANWHSPGIDHPTKTDFGMTVSGSIVEFDNVKIFGAAK